VIAPALMDLRASSLPFRFVVGFRRTVASMLCDLFLARVPSSANAGPRAIFAGPFIKTSNQQANGPGIYMGDSDKSLIGTGSGNLGSLIRFRNSLIRSLREFSQIAP